MGFAFRLVRKLVEQIAVDVIAHADGGDGDVLGQRVPLEFRKIFLRARSGNAVGEQDNVLVRGLLIHDGLEAGFHRLINLGAAVGGNLANEVALVFETPGGIGKEENTALGSGHIGPVEIINPEPGNWTLKVYGYNVPDTGESFKVSLKEYEEAQWSWITTKGPERLESDSNGTVVANLTIPERPSIHRLDGYIKISSDNYTVEIPVSVTLTGPKLQGLTRVAVVDSNKDGQFDLLTLGFGLNTTTPGEYRLEGALNDCSGNRIELIDQSQRLEKTGSIDVNISGTDIWRRGMCGPMQIQNLILRDDRGNFIDRFEGNITINRDPRQFQAPAAYLTGFVNQTTQDSIAI